ncbi:transposase [Niveispirillum sp. KHB5.9]|uniref:transposase n=1 Tax=Niveispirillum sp. KHB5.9 TaxID=3400269 RepID=UPI003A8A366E
MQDDTMPPIPPPELPDRLAAALDRLRGALIGKHSSPIIWSVKRSGKCGLRAKGGSTMYDKLIDPAGFDGLQFDGLIADKAFDSNAIIAELNQRGAKVVISQHSRRKQKLDIDADIYKWRHLIENFFCKLKEFKRIAMRADKTDTGFSAAIYLAVVVIHSR